MTQKECPMCGDRSTVRDEETYKKLMNRLNRIEGQIRGVKKMVEEERYCIDIINQVSAISSALNSFNKVLLADHIQGCVVKDVKAGNDEMIEELCETLQKLMK